FHTGAHAWSCGSSGGGRGADDSTDPQPPTQQAGSRSSEVLPLPAGTWPSRVVIQRCFLLCAAVLAAFLFPAGSHGAKSPPAHRRVGLIAHDNVTAYTRASTRSPVVAVLVQQTQIEILGSRGSWDHVSIWDSVHGWVPKHDIVFRRPW